MGKDNIKYKAITINDLDNKALNKFNRYQETKHVLFKGKQGYNTKDDYFVDDWNHEKKINVIESLKNCIKSGGIVIGAFLNDDLIGFGNVEGKLFGKNKEYVELSYIHVSNELRNMGIGKKIFELCCEGAKKLGAKKLYIGAHPSEETQSFYKRVGCRFAEEINEEIYNREPLDIQLEIIL